MLLNARGAQRPDVNALDRFDGKTPLQRAAAAGHEEVVRLLLAHGADPDRRDATQGNAALHDAAWHGRSRTVALLAAAGANLEPRNSAGFSPLHLCCQNGHNQSCRELLLGGCEPDPQNHYGDTPLHTAARYGHAGVARILVSAKCRVSVQNRNGDTPLHVAAAMGRRKLTRELLTAGSALDLRNQQGETPKDLAIRKGHEEVVRLLDSIPDRGPRSKSKDRRKKNKVRFESGNAQWSPYGCHYFPDPDSFPKPRLDSLPSEPLRKGEQYYLDLAGNICKGPIGVGYKCYCAPFFKSVEAKLERDKRALRAYVAHARVRLDDKMADLESRTQDRISELTRCVAAEHALCERRHERLERKLLREGFGRRSERQPVRVSPPPVTRSRSLELLDCLETIQNDVELSYKHNSKSMDLLDAVETTQKKRFENILPENMTFKSEVMRETASNALRHELNNDNKSNIDRCHVSPKNDKDVIGLELLNNKLQDRKSMSPCFDKTTDSKHCFSMDLASNNNYLVDKSELGVPVNISVREIYLNNGYSQRDEYDRRLDVYEDSSIMPNYENVTSVCSANVNNANLGARPEIEGSCQQQNVHNEIETPQHYYPNFDRRINGTYSLYDKQIRRDYDQTCNRVDMLNPNGNIPNMGSPTYVSSLKTYFENAPDSRYSREDDERRRVELRMLEHDVRNRIANLHISGKDKDLEHNDSGYSTKVYGSSKGNSPSLSGQLDPSGNKQPSTSTHPTIGVSSLV